jgi:hypothetical protein
VPGHPRGEDARQTHEAEEGTLGTQAAASEGRSTAMKGARPRKIVDRRGSRQKAGEQAARHHGKAQGKEKRRGPDERVFERVRCL